MKGQIWMGGRHMCLDEPFQRIRNDTQKYRTTAVVKLLIKTIQRTAIKKNVIIPAVVFTTNWKVIFHCKP